MSMSIYLHNKRQYQVKDTKEYLQRELQTTLGVCFFNCLCKLNVKMKHGILPGNIIENLPFPFSCLSSTKTSWRSKGITNLKHTTSALMSGCLYGKYTNDTQILQEAKGRSKILHDDFMFLYLTKPGVSIFSSTRWTSWCGPQCLSLLKCCILRSI